MADQDQTRTTTIDELVKQLSKPAPLPSPTPAPATLGPSAPAPVTPPRPPVSSPTPPSTPTPPRPEPKPIPPQPLPPTPEKQVGPQQFTSSIRTMQSDLSGSGKANSSTITLPPQPTAPTKPATPLSPQPAPISTPRPTSPAPSPLPTRPPTTPTPLEPIKVRPLQSPSTPLPSQSFQPSPAPRVPLPNASVPGTVPPSGPRISGKVYLLIALLVGMLGGFYWLSTSQKNSPEEEPAPNEEVTPNISTGPQSVSSIVAGVPQEVTVAATDKAIEEFYLKLRDLIVGGGQLKRLSLLDATNSSTTSFTGFLDRFLVQYPAELTTSLGSDSVIVIFGQKESFDANGQINPNPALQTRLGLIAEITDPALAIQTMALWEPTMGSSLAPIFNYDRTKASTPALLDGTYQGVSVRYQNFPQADKSLDYAIVPASNGKTYLVLTNSRESIFGIIDKIR